MKKLKEGFKHKRNSKIVEITILTSFLVSEKRITLLNQVILKKNDTILYLTVVINK